MKKPQLFLLLGLLLVAGIAMYTLNNRSAVNENANQQGKEYTSAYICPMHCEGSGNHRKGKCPVCHMDYIKNENYKPQEPVQGTQ